MVATELIGRKPLMFEDVEDRATHNIRVANHARNSHLERDSALVRHLHHPPVGATAADRQFEHTGKPADCGPSVTEIGREEPEQLVAFVEPSTIA
jgi:hypothetical protein